MIRMITKELQEPIYDDRVNNTLKGLLEGKSREELAEGFGLSTWKSLDIYMRRKGFTWDSEKYNYIPATTKVDKILEEVASNVPIKAQQIIRKFEQYGKDADPRAIAKDMGFEDHREMAKYMEEKGLLWNSEEGNYVEELKMQNTSVSEKIEETISDKVLEMSSRKQEDYLDLLITYLPLLQMLSENKDRLLDLLMPNSEGNIPKYAVPGVPKTKSIYMSDLLARLVTEFSGSKNLSQREVVEAALIEYLKRYGYQMEVEKLLAKK
jgi:hypothetical protein